MVVDLDNYTRRLEFLKILYALKPKHLAFALCFAWRERPYQSVEISPLWEPFSKTMVGKIRTNLQNFRGSRDEVVAGIIRQVLNGLLELQGCARAFDVPGKPKVSFVCRGDLKTTNLLLDCNLDEKGDSKLAKDGIPLLRIGACWA